MHALPDLLQGTAHGNVGIDDCLGHFPKGKKTQCHDSTLR